MKFFTYFPLALSDMGETRHKELHLCSALVVSVTNRRLEVQTFRTRLNEITFMRVLRNVTTFRK